MLIVCWCICVFFLCVCVVGVYWCVMIWYGVECVCDCVECVFCVVCDESFVCVCDVMCYGVLSGVCVMCEVDNGWWMWLDVWWCDDVMIDVWWWRDWCVSDVVMMGWWMGLDVCVWWEDWWIDCDYLFVGERTRDG